MMWWPEPVAGIPTPPIIRAAKDLPDRYYVGLVLIVGAFWLSAYVFAIAQARIDGRAGIPAIACALNIGWELNDSFVVNHSAWQRPFNFAWFLLDLLIIAQVLRHGHKDYPELSARQFKRMVAAVCGVGVLMIAAIEIEINDFYGAYTGLILNSIMSVMFVRTLIRRQSSAGQSLYIALCKGIGSALGVLMSVSLYPYSLVIPVLGVIVIGFDVYYTVALVRKMREEGRNPWALPRVSGAAKPVTAVVAAPKDRGYAV
ncbi:hypothetical protein ACIA8C_04970 [Nocardia sp. NPDC051321]|uniref:transmembrane-type terpene cyclase n=1 Tax=Nocardia sp. NPDC051321 TaxID=3364323 RepID=UPI0037B5D928